MIMVNSSLSIVQVVLLHCIHVGTVVLGCIPASTVLQFPFTLHTIYPKTRFPVETTLCENVHRQKKKAENVGPSLSLGYSVNRAE